LDDNYIVTSGIDGAVYQWSLKDIIKGECKRGSESFLKSCLYTSAICSNDCQKNYAVGSDKTLKVIIIFSIFSIFLFYIYLFIYL